MKRATLVGMAASVLVIVAAATGAAQGDYPSRAAQIVVPFPPGGNTTFSRASWRTSIPRR
jgi:tripartite-type tricarboxylate transporter receptor subunit TctC